GKLEIIAPQSEEELAELVATAMRKQTPLEIIGAGSRKGYGNPVAATSQVSTRAISGITLYEPAALT
ncbi:MAG: hypothetical protein KDJ66_03370, partial [Nitratireductor sp.]|nr:hypothetical protein [Nitratireductor sp.]